MVLCINFCSIAQDSPKINRTLRLGFNYGYGTQQNFPFNSTDYTYDVQFYKLQINYGLKGKRKWKLELNIEPSIYTAEHQLLNIYYVQPKFGNDYLDKRVLFAKHKQFNEYVLNTGLLLRHNTFKQLDTYVLGSIGPMISNTETERLVKGFAFSDIIALGISYEVKSIFLDLRFSIRHVSNATIKLPNSGHNSANMEIGFSFQL